MNSQEAFRIVSEAATRARKLADTVPRSRLNAVEAELTEAKEKLAKVQKDAGVEIERLMALLQDPSP